MSNDNRISASLTQDDLDKLIASLADMRATLPFLINLTPQERREVPRLGDKSVAFDEKCVGYMVSHPSFIPGYISIDELQKDRALRSQMLRLAQEYDALGTAISDTLAVIGSEIWMADLAYYHSVREAAKRGRDGAQAVFEDLRQRFPHGPRGSAAPAATPVTE